MNKNGQIHSAKLKPHWAFLITGLVSLIWFLMGSANFIYQMMPGSIDSYPQTERLIISDRPVWATLGFALSVFGGLSAALAMLLRRQVCEPLFLASLVGTMAATGHSLLLGINPGFAMMFLTVALPIGLGIFFVWYAALARRKEWLR
jgi:hypothetical protein